MKFTIIAQSYTTNQRITRLVIAKDEAAALLFVSRSLETSGFYVIEIASC